MSVIKSCITSKLSQKVSGIEYQCLEEKEKLTNVTNRAFPKSLGDRQHFFYLQLRQRGKTQTQFRGIECVCALNVLPLQERNRKSEVRVIYIYRNVYIICISKVYAKHRKQQHNNDSKVSHAPLFFPNPTQVQLGKLLMPPGRQRLWGRQKNCIKGIVMSTGWDKNREGKSGQNN